MIIFVTLLTVLGHVRVQPFMMRTIAHHTHGPVGPTQQYGTGSPPRPPSGCRNEERNTPSLVNQSVVIGRNGGISWIADYVIRSHEHN